MRFLTTPCPISRTRANVDVYNGISPPSNGVRNGGIFHNNAMRQLSESQIKTDPAGVGDTYSFASIVTLICDSKSPLETVAS